MKTKKIISVVKVILSICIPIILYSLAFFIAFALGRGTIGTMFNPIIRMVLSCFIFITSGLLYEFFGLNYLKKSQ